MNDYLQPAGKIWRITCCIASGIAAAALLFGAAVLWTSMFREWKFTFDGKPLWIGAIIISGVGVAAAFITVRLARGDRAPDGVTTLPTWFIQLFGILLLIGVCFVAYDKGDVFFAMKGVSICMAMILVSTHLANRRKAKRPNQAVHPTTGSVTPRAPE